MEERYLLSLDLHAVPQLNTQVLVIGSGLAGLAAALAAGEEAQVLLATKDVLEESASQYAQGGVAASIGPDDSPELHLQDTLASGAELGDEAAVRTMVEEGVDRCRELVAMGVPFKREGEDLSLTMEGAHSRRRILHANDATGAAMVNTLLTRVRAHDNIHVFEKHFVIDLLHHDGECYGAVMLDTVYGRLLRVRAEVTVLASGGLGQIFRETTNPEVATGDGYALAWRAGARLRDMEFVQFHPTTLYLAGAPRFLISESVRGEGGQLLNAKNERFMARYDKRGELAPRDIVSQSIIKEMRATEATHVNLDLRHLGRARIEERFPTIQRICIDFGLDLAEHSIPVRPAVHYMMGGVEVDLHGRTRVRRLLAAGEVASTGVHGANRLASNSLLEGLVFGWRAGKAALQISDDMPGAPHFPVSSLARRVVSRVGALQLEDVVQSLRSLTWRDLGIFRHADGLQDAWETIRFWEKYVLPEQFQAQRGFEIQNMLTVAKVIAWAARERTESRGAHQRLDFPQTQAAWRKHQSWDIATFARAVA